MFLVVGKNLTIPVVCSCSGASRRNLIPNKGRHTQDLAEGSWKAENQCFGAFLFDKYLIQWHLADKIIYVCAKVCVKQLEGVRCFSLTAIKEILMYEVIPEVGSQERCCSLRRK